MGELAGWILFLFLLLICMFWESKKNLSIGKKLFNRIFNSWEKWELVEEDYTVEKCFMNGTVYKTIHYDIMRRENKYTGIYQFKKIRRN